MLENVTAKLRPRSPWESVDLGLAIARRHFAECFGKLVLVWGPLWLILAVLLRGHPFLCFFLIWWLKPLYARIPLWVLSRRLFGMGLNWAAFRKDLPGLFLKHNWFTLTFGRFSFWRALVMPIRVLEQTQKHVFRQRASQLRLHGESTIVWCGLFFLLASMAIATSGLLSLLNYVPNLFVPEGENYFQVVRATWHGDSSALTVFWWLNVFWLLGSFFSEIFYVAAGFGAYLNSRTVMEGWDVEVAFRGLRSRFDRIHGTGTVLLMAGIFCCLTQSSPASTASTPLAAPTEAKAEAGPKQRGRMKHPRPATAASSPAVEPTTKVPVTSLPAPTPELQTMAEKVLAHPDFKVHEHEEWHAVPESTSSGSRWFDFSFLRHLGDLGPLLMIAGYSLLVCLVAFLIWIILKYVKPLPASPAAAKAAQPIRVVAGMEISPEKLPADIRTAALQALRNGDIHEALRLLYAGSLRWMVLDAHLPIRNGDTEGDCLRHSQHLPEKSTQVYFQQLTQCWILSAYASRHPAATELEQMVGSWPFNPANRNYR